MHASLRTVLHGTVSLGALLCVAGEARGQTASVTPTDGPAMSLPADPSAVLPDEATAPTSADPYTMTVRGSRPGVPLAASASSLSGDDVTTRARTTTYDFLHLVPNLVVGLHEGGGKAPQFLLRGFDADHGSDLALYVDGIPVNEVSHVHGLGYLDLHFLIPELIERIDVRKGPYQAEDGSFATAGSLRLTLRSSLPASEVGWSVGSFGTQRGLGILTTRLGPATGVTAFETQHTDGFTAAGQSTRYNAQSRFSMPMGDGRLDLLVVAYAGDWQAPGLVPQREVLNGHLDRLGAFDPHDGGTSQRTILGLTWTQPVAQDVLTAQVYAQHRQLALYHDFTGYLVDPVHGDQVAQLETRTTLGGEVGYRTSRAVRGWQLRGRSGLQWRSDAIEPELWQTEARQKRALTYRRSLAETTVSPYTQQELVISPRWSLHAGLRCDATVWDVQDPQAIVAPSGPRTSGSASASVWSPKASVVFQATPTVHLFANAGRGLRITDARAAILPTFTGLATATGAEVGARTWWLDRRVQVAGIVWGMRTTRDVVFLADDGTNEEVGPARRYGGELEARVQVKPWLIADLDTSYTFAHDESSGQVLARAPRWLAAGGLTARHGQTGLFGSVRARHVGRFALDDGGAHLSQAYTVVDGVLGWQGRWLGLTVQAQNLLDTAWRDSEYYYVNAVQGQAPVGDVQFRPGEPRFVMAVAKVLF